MAKLTRQSLKFGIFRSGEDLEAATSRYAAAMNRDSEPFVRTATAEAIGAKLAPDHPPASAHQRHPATCDMR